LEQFTLHKVFAPRISLGFGAWGTVGSRGQVGRVILVLRTFLRWCGGLCKFGGDWAGGSRVKEGHR